MPGKANAMSSVRIEIDESLAALLQETEQPVQAAAKEMIVLELYRRGTISSGKAAELLGMSRVAFIQHASSLGIPYLEMTDEEWAAERAASESL
jgi:predicted HTH domain antitoxin